MKKPLLLTVLFATFNLFSQSPITVSTTQYSPAALVTDVLFNNPCIQLSNISSSTGSDFGGTNGIGYFVNQGNDFPLASGIVLSTGNALNLSVPGANLTLSDGAANWPGDTQLAQYLESMGISQSGTYFNASKLEFDFVSQNNFMAFNFVFASEEYGNFQCTFSDAFAFFLTDTETNETINLALVPGTTQPISVVTVRDAAHNEGCPSVNPEFFGAFSEQGASYLEFNGHTVVMTASASIVPGKTYRVKMVVADRNDTAFDSAIFIEAGSFQSGVAACSDHLNLNSFIDSNANGTRDQGEVFFKDGTFNITRNNDEPVLVNTPNGIHKIFGVEGNSYDVSYSIYPEYQAFLLCNSTYENIAPAAGSGETLLNFPIHIVQDFTDVSVDIIPLSPPIAGSTYANRLVVHNHGLLPVSGTLNFTAPTETPLTGTGNSSYSVLIDNLLPFSSASYDVTMDCPPVPQVTMGALVSASVEFTTATTDLNLENNTSTLNSEILASYDPNDKAEMHGPEILITSFGPTDQLYYTIRYQNLGTATAYKVRIEDMLDAKIDESSVRMVSASHDYVLERSGSGLTWQFEGINLAPAIVDEELSKGHVTFRARLKPGIEVGDIIPNTAEIYFDSNPVIITNTWTTTFVDLLATYDFSESLRIHPNPVSAILEISLGTTVPEILRLYDLTGKLILEKKNASQLDVQELSNGLYLLEVTSGQMIYRKKISKR